MSEGDSSSGKHKKKSKKKKDKHKHKKKHKHSDHEGGSPSLRLVVSKSNSAFGGLKIKIPIKDVASVVNPQLQSQASATGQPAPIKFKEISSYHHQQHTTKIVKSNVFFNNEQIAMQAQDNKKSLI